MALQREGPLEMARALARDALGQWRGADPDRAIEACDHALALLLSAGASDALADVLRWKGSVLRDRGSLSQADELYVQSLNVADAVGYQPGRAHALNCLGAVAQVRGDGGKAERFFGDAARLAHRLADRRLSAMIQQNLGILAEDQGRTDEAIAHFRLALVAFEQEGQRDAMLWVLNNLGVLYTREGAYPRAHDVLEQALELARELSDVASEGIVEENRATLLVAMGRLDDAELAATRAYSVAEQRRDNIRRAAALRAFARVTRARDRLSTQIVTLLERALALCEVGEDVLLRAEVLSDLGDACRERGETGRARDYWRRALEVARLAGFSSMIVSLQARLRRSSAGGSERGSEVITA
jgi:tetratricopeptide (TPR) repeat protein